jgi:hypothetical protein
MLRLSITAAAFDAISRTLPLGSVGYERERTATGDMFIWIDKPTADKLEALRRTAEGYSDIIIKLAAIERG